MIMDWKIRANNTSPHEVLQVSARLTRYSVASYSYWNVALNAMYLYSRMTGR
jgi:hypothetical protein